MITRTKAQYFAQIICCLSIAAGFTACSMQGSRIHESKSPNLVTPLEDPVSTSEAQARSNYLSLAFARPWTLNALDDTAIRNLFEFVKSHPVANVNKLKQYDPSGAIGFCFGRSTAVTLSARISGLDPTEIRQLFVVGDLRSGSAPEWRFHVTTLVRGITGTWIALDPIMPAPMPMDAWIDRVSSIWDRNSKAQFYITPFDTIIPDLTTVPDVSNETGENLIEISFNPAQKAGFTPIANRTQRLYELTRQTAQRYFFTSTEVQRFNFDGIRINSMQFNYNNYFADLFADLEARDSIPATAAPLGTSSVATANEALPLGLNVKALNK
jgi:hypothetical protein